MAAKEHLIKVNLPGGVISAGDLYELLEIARKNGATHVRFGNRQQLYFTIEADNLEDLEFDMLSAEISYETDAHNYPNIISSYAADTIFNHENWLKEGVYKDIFDLFDFKPRLKINLVDSNQTFVPFFTGNFNFISSGVSNYWHLHIRYPKTNISYNWPSLVYSDDIPAISKKMEQIIFANKGLFYDTADIDSELFHDLVQKQSSFVQQPVDQQLKIPSFQLPYYEGFNRYGNKYWLGIYRRDELFPIDFLADICSLCMQTRVGQLYTTPWKSVLIKGIELTDRVLWGDILDKYRINIRHAANELNWQTEDVCDYSLALKRALVRDFEEADLRTYKLVFAIKKQPKTGLAGSVILKRNGENYDVLHTRDFNPNSKDLVLYREQLAPDQLSSCLMALCDDFYGRQGASRAAEAEENNAELVQGIEDTAIIYQCKHCLGVYDEMYGDALNDIAPGTPFEALSDYHCPTCEAPKTDFESKTVVRC